MGFLREDICEVFASFRYDWFCYLSDLGGDGGLADQFSSQPHLLFMQSVGDFLVHIKA